MKQLIFFLIIGSLTFLNAIAQHNENSVIMVVAGDSITKGEFEKVYNKNNPNKGNYDMKDLREYLQLYVNYKLKVKEAESLRLDTNPAFISELRGYRKQLAQPYMTDKSVSDALLKEAYDRMQYDIHASHILISCADDALPKDTLEAYNRAVKIRKQVLDGTEFGTLAAEVSADPSAKTNNGDLGFFTALQMVYPFESAAYNTEPGKISMPVRTRFGYHIIKVHEKRAAKGTIQVAHIMVKAASDAPDSIAIAAKAKIDEIYNELNNGADFEELAAKYSDDKASGRKGGELPPFGTGRMVPEFEKASFSLAQDGDLSPPVRTSYGWHIIRRISLTPIPPFDKKKPELRNQVNRDSRANLGKESKIAQIKKDYNLKEYPKNYTAFVNKLDTSLTNGMWDPQIVQGMEKPLFSIGDSIYKQSDFARYINNHQSKKTTSTPKQVAYNLYQQFVDESCFSYEEANLENKYPEFASLMKEYRDGILLFDLTDQKVWSKAVKDTTGLDEFHRSHRNDYMWGQRLDAVIYTCKTEDIAKRVRKYIKKKKNPTEIQELINVDSKLNLTIKADKFQSGENEIIDQIVWIEGLSDNVSDKNGVSMVDVIKVMDPEPKELSEAKGVITADYQNYLEEQWISELRSKYDVSINEEVVESFAKD
jgi:peptidyl-prolyl cis-trans isomerase SurA